MARQIAAAAVDVLRSAHMVLDPVTGVYVPSTLLEPAGANGWDQTQAFDHANWTKADVTVTADAHAAPDGTATADKIVESATTAAHGIRRNITGTVDGNSIALSWFVKASERSWVRIAVTGRDGVIGRVWFNLATGTVGTVEAGMTAYFIRSLGNGWWRIGVTRALGAGATTPIGWLLMSTADAQNSYAGDGVSGIFAWGAQVEIGPVATSYMTAARSADSFRYPFTAPPQEMTVYTRHIEHGSILMGTGEKVWAIEQNSSSSPRFIVDIGSGTVARYRAIHTNAGGTQVTAPLGVGTTPTIGDRVELCAQLYADGAIQLHQSVNGAAAVSSAKSAAHVLAAAWQTPNLWVNRRGSGNPGVSAFLANARGQLVTVRYGVKTMTEMRDAFAEVA